MGKLLSITARSQGHLSDENSISAGQGLGGGGGEDTPCLHSPVANLGIFFHVFFQGKAVHMP